MLGEAGKVRIPNFVMPPLMNNHHNYIVSMGNVCRWLAEQAESLCDGGKLNQYLKDQILNANTAAEVLALTHKNNIDLPSLVAEKAQATAIETLRDANVNVEIMVVDRQGKVLARHG